METHEYADLFPMMDELELTALAEDIKINGQIEPIYTYEGQILDGRNRHAACKLAGISPDIREYEGDDPLGFVVALNLKRRHMTPTQRAMLGAELKAQYAKEAKERQDLGVKVPEGSDKGRSRDMASDAVGVSATYVDMAEQIKEKAPEIVKDVLRGEVPIKQAREIAKVKAPTARKRVLERVKKDKANYEQTKRIISDETKTSPPKPEPKDPDTIHFSWIKDPDVTSAEDGWNSLFTQAERMANTGQQPAVARDILNKWVAKAQNFVEAFDE
jgi:ParB-like chromosome segregation protein Spo0J